MALPGWNSATFVRYAHDGLEGAALLFFAALVVFDVLAHFAATKNKERVLERIALFWFGVAVLAEIIAYPYSRRNDELASNALTDAQKEIAVLTKAAQDSKAKAEGFRLDIARATERASEADLRSAEAKRGAAQAQRHVAEAEKEAAGANEKAEAERLARVQIEGQLQWRSVSPGQSEVIGSSIPRIFGGTRLKVTCIAGDAEGALYAQGLSESIRKAGWIIDGIDAALFTGVLPSGVFIQVSDKDNLAAAALQHALRAAGINAPGQIVQELQGTVQLLVGVKPHQVPSGR